MSKYTTPAIHTRNVLLFIHIFRLFIIQTYEFIRDTPIVLLLRITMKREKKKHAKQITSQQFIIIDTWKQHSIHFFSFFTSVYRQLFFFCNDSLFFSICLSFVNRQFYRVHFVFELVLCLGSDCLRSLLNG